MKKFFSSSTTKNALLEPFKLGPYNLKNRVVMSAMTRCRSDPATGVPIDLHVKYYSERAEHAGFVLTECSQISRVSDAFPGAAGIYSEDQVRGWKKVTEAVHSVNGRIYLQIYHGGRACYKNFIGENPVAASPLAIRNLDKDKKMFYRDQPEELTEDGILKIVDQFKYGAENALNAGFDGIELHGGNGYLIDGFLKDASNKRTDKYGGSIENRCRFPLMVVDALISVFGADRIGAKFSPIGRYNDMCDSDPLSLYSYLLQELDKRKISFVELYRESEAGQSNFYNVNGYHQLPDTLKQLRPYFKGPLIGNGSMTLEESNTLIKEGVIELASFARNYIANPDLPLRFANNWPLSQFDWRYLYTGGAEGYNTYPKYNSQAKF